MVLASALIYTSFSAASPALTPSQLLREAQPGRSYQLTGTVVNGSVHREGAVLDFSVADRAGGTAIPLAYTGTVPDPFREGREVIVTVEKQGDALRRRTQLADHQVPVQVQDRSSEREAERLSAPGDGGHDRPGRRR